MYRASISVIFALCITFAVVAPNFAAATSLRHVPSDKLRVLIANANNGIFESTSNANAVIIDAEQTLQKHIKKTNRTIRALKEEIKAYQTCITQAQNNSQYFENEAKEVDETIPTDAKIESIKANLSKFESAFNDTLKIQHDEESSLSKAEHDNSLASLSMMRLTTSLSARSLVCG